MDLPSVYSVRRWPKQPPGTTDGLNVTRSTPRPSVEPPRLETLRNRRKSFESIWKTPSKRETRLDQEKCNDKDKTIQKTPSK